MKDLIRIIAKPLDIVLDINRIIAIENFAESYEVDVITEVETYKFTPTTKQGQKELYNALIKKFNEDVDPNTIKTYEVL